MNLIAFQNGVLTEYDLWLLLQRTPRVGFTRMFNAYDKCLLVVKFIKGIYSR